MATPEQTPGENASPISSSTADAWDRIADELRACKESQKRTWGDIDSSTLGRYLAGEVADDERGAIERELNEHPDLRQLTDLVRDVLGELPPVADEPVAEPPVLLSLASAPAVKRRRWLPTVRRYAGLAAAACLLVALAGIAPPNGPQPASAPVHAELAMLPELGGALARNSATSPTLFTTVLLPGSASEPLGEAPPAMATKVAAPAPPAAPVAPAPLQQEAKIEVNRKLAFFVQDGKNPEGQRSLASSYGYCRKRLGANHPYTTRAAQELATMYAPALNMDTNSRGLAPESVQRIATSADGKFVAITREEAAKNLWYARDMQGAHVAQLRNEIQNQTLSQVQTNVVPVLVRALQTSQTPGERQELVRALGNLGVAASPALPALEQCLNSATPGETRAILFTLGQIGPSAVPVLDRLTSGGNNKDAKNERRKLSEPDRRLVQVTLRKLRSPECFAGIADEAGCLNFRQIRTTSMQLRRLHKAYGVTVLVETTPPAANAEPRFGLNQLGKHGVHVVIEPGTPSVQVTACPALEKAGFSAEAVREGTLKACAGKNLEGACDAAVRLIREQSVKLHLGR